MQKNKEQLDWLLKEVKRILNNIGIPFCLSRGTLLGLIRDGELISWDNDIDILSIADIRSTSIRSLIYEEFKKAGFGVSLRNKNFEWGEEEAFHFAFSANMLKDKGDYFVGMKFIKNCDGIIRETNVPVRYDVGTFQPFKQIFYQGEYYCIPQNPEKLFETWYGKNWKTRARSVYILKDDRTNDIKIYPDQSIAWRKLSCKEVYLECDKKGNFIKPYNKISNNIRARNENPDE